MLLLVCVGLSGATVQRQQPRPRDDDDNDDDDDDDAQVMTELSLKCVVDGRPAPSVEWLRNYVRSAVCLSVSSPRTLTQFTAARSHATHNLPSTIHARFSEGPLY